MLYILVLTKWKLLHMYGILSGYAKNKSKSRLIPNLLKFKSLVNIDGVSCKSPLA